MGTVGSTESIIDEKVEGSGKLLNEFRLVLGFLLVETGVLEHDNITFSGISNNLGNILANAVRGKSDSLAKEFRHTFGARSEGELVLGTICRAAQMGADSHNGTLALQVLDGGDGRTDTGIISDGLSVKGDIDITTDKDLLSLELVIGQILNGFLGLKLENRRGSHGADTELSSRGESRAGAGNSKKGKGGVEELHFRAIFDKILDL
mmetsp:Transcript_10162/g.14260  ORF Transcript_10162/g.14260 Transcript_10162/m.14260 type:complete len:207 (-) Transcript_10162:349-969(-)